MKTAKSSLTYSPLKFDKKRHNQQESRTKNESAKYKDSPVVLRSHTEQTPESDDEHSPDCKDLFSNPDLSYQQWQEEEEDNGDTFTPYEGRSPHKKPSDPKQSEKYNNDRWQQLYAKKQMYDQKREQLIKESKRMNDPECTFKPKLLSTNVVPQNPNCALPVHQRNQIWMERQQAKLEEASKKEQQRDLVDCTFKPIIHPSVKRPREDEKIQNKDFKGVNQHLRRQAQARQNKEDKEAILNHSTSRTPERTPKRERPTTATAVKPGASKENVFKSSSSKKPTTPSCQTPTRTKTPSSVHRRSETKQETSFQAEVTFRPERKAGGVKPDDIIQVTEVTYCDAIKQLRAQLHSIRINFD